MRAEEAYEAIRNMLWIWDMKRDTPVPAVKPTVETLMADGLWTLAEAEEYVGEWDQEEEDRTALRARAQARAARLVMVMLAADPTWEVPDEALDALPPLIRPRVPEVEPPRRLSIVPERGGDG